MPIKRPLTPDELQQLQSEGYDMSRYRGEDIEIPDAPQQTSALGTGTRSALASAIPTAAGGAGFAGAMGLLAPETMGASLLAIPVAAGAGYLASKLASKGQEAVIPDSWKQSIATGEQEHPWASRAGSLATLPLGGFRIDPSGIARAASGLPKFLVGGNSVLSIGERQALLNAASSGALGGIQEAVMAPAEGRPITAGNVALNALIGATHTAPMEFAQKYYGFHPSVGDTTPEQYQQSATLTPEQMARTQELRKPSVDLPQYALGPEQLFGQLKEAPKDTIDQRWNKVVQKAYLGQDTGLDEYVTGVDRLKGAHKDTIDSILKDSGTYDKWVTNQPDYTGSKNQDSKEGLSKGYKANNYWLDSSGKFSLVTDHYSGAKDYLGNNDLTEDEAYTKMFSKNSLRIIENPDEIMYQGPDPTIKQLTELKSRAVELNKNLIQDRGGRLRIVYSPENKLQTLESTLTPEGASVQQKLPNNVSWTPAYQKLINPILERHGFQVEENGELVSADGQSLKGQAVPGKVIRTVINPNKASLDTPIHEGFHGLQFLTEGGNKPAAELLGKLNNASAVGLKQYNDLRAIAGKKPMTMDEFTATQQGFEFVKQAFNLDKETKWQKWWNDTKALFKSKYSENASVDDLRRAVNYRIVNDPKLGGKGVSVSPGVVQNQPEDEGLGNEFIDKVRHNSDKLFDDYIDMYKDKIMGTMTRKEAGKYISLLTNYEPYRQEFVKEFGDQGIKFLAQLDNHTKSVSLANGLINPGERNQPQDEGLPQPEKIANTPQQRDAVVSYLKDNLDKVVKEIDTKYENAVMGDNITGVGQAMKAMGFKSTLGEYVSRNALDEHPMAGDLALGFIKPFIAARDFTRIEDVVKTARKSLGLENQKFDENIASKMAEEKRIAAAKEYYKSMPHLKTPDEYRNQPTTEGLTDKNQLGVDIEAKKFYEGKLAQARKWLNDPETRPEQKEDLRNQINFFNKQLNGEPRTPEALNQPEDEGLKQHTAPGIGNFRPTEASFDRVSRKVDPELGKAYNNWRARKDQFTAIGTTALSDLDKFPPQLVDQVEQKMSDAYRSGKTAPDEVIWTPEEKQVFDTLSTYYQKMRNIQNVLGLKINGREASSNPFYVPHQLNDTTRDLFSRKGNTPEAQAKKREWAQHVADSSNGEVSFDEALDNIHDFVSALGGARENYKVVNFGAIRRAAGYGLPNDLRETNALRSLDKYNRRASNDLAMYSELESKPEIANKLELKDPNTGLYHEGYKKGEGYGDNEPVRDAMKWVTGNWSGTIAQEMPLINSISRLVHSLLLSTPTGVKNTIQTIPNMVPYLDRWSDLGAMWKGLLALRDNRRAALETGATIPQIDKITMNDLGQSPVKATAYLQKGATLLRKWQGSEALENLQRDTTFSIGKELAKARIVAAAAGDVKAGKWLDKFGLLVDGDITKLQGPELEQAINTTAKNFVDRNQGTYSGSGLPAGVMESQFAPFLALQKWSIEKSNVIYQDVFKPFMTGENRLPMLTYALGTFLTGAAIQKINELITNRKGQDPTWQEALDSGNPKQIAAELVTLMQLSSYAGIVSDGLKFATDITLTGKTPQNIVSFPAATAILNIEKQTRDMAEALRNGENPWEVLKAYTLDLAQHQVQLGRVLLNHTVKEQDVERSDKFRDLRVWNEMNGAPAADITTSNPYLGIGEKKFKKTQDIGEAVGMIPEIMKRAQEKAQGNPEKLRKAFSSVSGNSYQTMPSFETNPMTFQQYYQFLVKTQGQEVADERMQDYIRQSTMNKIKSSFIPRL